MRFRDVDALLMSWLAGGLPAAADVVGDRPADTDWARLERPIVRAQSTGGPPAFSVVLQRTEYVCEVWAVDSVAASDLAAEVAELITALPGVRGDVVVYDASAAVPRLLPDESGIPRFFFTGSILCRLAGS